ncbi:centrosomal protein of 131 kDa isoform X2 [Photinus pyralis]|uniref:centrosomal protein of 131 kDa isoform X2 n=1 Tax=Photinus pyralis TaxID=7054 RepID=UPI001266FEB7|nr:centrosomal protein of 131 kDa isoform X2 [Photinus pyralis]
MEVSNEDNLRLDGCQIQLKMRPFGDQGKASSRCALLGRDISRPFSAIPLLNLGRNEFDDCKNSTRRPWSADNPPRFQHSAYETIYTDGSVDSAEEMLPSSALLDDLLSETLYSWRNGKRTKQSRKGKHARRCPPKLTKRAVRPYENDTPSADSDTNSSAESVTKTELVEKRAAKSPSPVNEYEERIKAMALRPGLKTKPPIPKKPQTSPSSRKSFHDTQNFELITDNMVGYLPVDHSQSSTSTLDEVKWFDERKTHDEVQASEVNTDLSIQHLKQSQATQGDSESDVAHTTQLNDISNFEPKVTGAKRVNFENVDFSMYEKRKMKPCPKNFIKENIKLTSRRSRKKPSSSDSDESLNNAAKFVPTPIRSADCSRKPPTDVESWMARDEGAKPTYSACLDRVDELQEVCKGTRLAEVDVSDADDGSTYDDIVEILQTLEEEDKRSQTTMEAMKKMVSEQLSENQKHAKQDVDTDPGHPQRDEEQPSRSSISSSTNLNDIFHFLDEVDKNCSKSLSCAKERFATASQLLNNGLHLDTIPRLEELLEHSDLELSNYVIQLSLRLKEKSSSVALLQKELSSLREQVAKMSREASETVRQKLRLQKEDYENAVKRHQKFIDQLITDKKTLNQQCEGLVQEMKVLEDRYNSNLKAAEHKHRVELQKLKEMHTAGEKMRRDRWIDSKTQKIKEMTVKGLEPELDKMNARHQQELMDLRMLHKREIEDMELRSARKLQQHCEALRDQLVTEREKALAQEREALRQRYEHMVEAEEQGFQEQRRRLLGDHAKRVSECEDRENAAIAEKERAVKQAQSEFEDKLQTVMRKHNIELNLLKEKTEMEMETFRNNYKKQVALQLGEKEAQIREKCRKERDKEIDSVIERLELEASENKQQLEESLENRIRRLKEKYEKEIRDLEQSERDINGKYSENKLKLAEADEQILTMKTSSKQLELQLLDLKELTAKLSGEREHVKEIIKDEMKQEVRGLEKELQEVKSDKERELQKVVKVAVARKDETISELSRDHIALQEKCAYLESMLEQQRKEYLMK